MQTRDMTDHDDLNKPRPRTCVSIFLPSDGTPGDSEFSGRRLSYLAGNAAGILKRQGADPHEVRELLAPVYEASRQSDFRRNSAPGWAVFLAPGFFRCQPLPFAVRELVVIDDRFHVTPLLTAAVRPEHFYLLALSEDRARLFAAARGSVVEVLDTSFPAGPVSAGGRTGSTSTGLLASLRDRFAVFSRWTRAGPSKQDLLTWFRHVDEVLRNRLVVEAAPIILVATRDLCMLFRSVSRYERLLEGDIYTSPETPGSVDLWQRGCEIVSAYSRSMQRKITDEYLRLWHTPRASNDVRDIAVAARRGRVQSLLVSEATQHRELPSAHRDRNPELDDEVQDLLRLAVIDTVVTGGTAYALPGDQVPGTGPAAAVFRY
jgi:hypothetical protein